MFSSFSRLLLLVFAWQMLIDPAFSQLPQPGGTSLRNNAVAQPVPLDWKFEASRQSREIAPGKNVRWVSRLGSVSFGTPVVASGNVYVSTNNQAGYLEAYPAAQDMGCLICFRAESGEFAWQYSSSKLSTGRVHDWPMQGICSTPVVERDRLWLVNNRGEVVCLDTEGFYDQENDGPVIDEPDLPRQESKRNRHADVVWRFDMMNQLGTRQHNMACCSPTIWGDLLFVSTSNGVDETHANIPAPDAPSFLCLDKHTGEVIWSDNSPGENILHGQWSSPAVGRLGGVPQVIFAGGDGYLRSFRADRGVEGKPTLLWKFDCNRKESVWKLGGRGDRNNIVATPVIYREKVYVATGQEPEHGEGPATLWCIDPTRRGDISSQLVLNAQGKPAEEDRTKAASTRKGTREVRVVDNPASAVVWKYEKHDYDRDGKIEFKESLHRTISSPVMKDGLLIQVDFSGMVHCIEADSGKPLWTADALSACWSTPLIAGQHVYVTDEDGEVAIYPLTATPPAVPSGAIEPVHKVYMESSIYSAPVATEGTLYVATRSHLFAISEQGD